MKNQKTEHRVKILWEMFEMWVMFDDEELLIKSLKALREEVRTYPVFELDENTNITADVIKLIPQEVAEKYCLLPVELRKNQLTIAMERPNNLPAKDDVAFLTGKEVTVIVVDAKAIHKAIKKYYTDQTS